MGMVDHEPYIYHFSHPHGLDLNTPQNQEQNLNTNPQNPPLLCSCCKTKLFGLMYSCHRCNYHLHLRCTKFPQKISHPSHPIHPLTLLPLSTYRDGVFNCDACNLRGNGFCYHCSQCEFDLHVVCSCRPLSIIHPAHLHPLALTFRNPYEAKGFFCDLCKMVSSNQWFYHCGDCEFDAHMYCAVSTLSPSAPPQPVEQPQPPQPHLLQQRIIGSDRGENSGVGPSYTWNDQHTTATNQDY